MTGGIAIHSRWEEWKDRVLKKLVDKRKLLTNIRALFPGDFSSFK